MSLGHGLPVISQSTLADPQTQTQLAAMENKFFEHDFSKESVDYRLARLEKFAFGQTTPGNTDARIKKLSAVIDLHPNLVPPPSAPVAAAKPPAAAPTAQAPADSDESYADDDEDDTPGKYPHITALEKQILKQAYENDSITARLSRLETTAFGKPSSSNDNASRTDALETYVETKLHQKPYAVNPYNDSSRQPVTLAQGGGASGGSQQQGAPSRSRSLLMDTANILANSVLGMASPVPMGGMMPYTGPIRSDDADEDAPKPEDPAVFQESPPDAHARMLVRVGWCEQHLFGHTYPNLHLQQRLHQLNAELYPNDHEPDIKLMDRLDVIVKAVVMKQHPPLAWNGGH
jgi:hypothetical protein